MILILNIKGMVRNMSYFPMYVELSKEPCLVVGGGKIAWHKVKVLREFQAVVTVVALEVDERIGAMSDVTIIKREYRKEDIQGMKLVVAATDDGMQNHRISKDCKELGVAVNAVDQIEDCDFIFPSYVKKGPIVASVSSGGQSPLITQLVRDEIQEVLTDEIGEIAKFLGSVRPLVKDKVSSPEKRKWIYKELYKQGQDGIFPTIEDVERLIDDEENETFTSK